MIVPISPPKQNFKLTSRSLLTGEFRDLLGRFLGFFAGVLRFPRAFTSRLNLFVGSGKELILPARGDDDRDEGHQSAEPVIKEKTPVLSVSALPTNLGTWQ